MNELLVIPENLDASFDRMMVQQVGDLQVAQQVVHSQHVEDAAVDSGLEKRILENYEQLKVFKISRIWLEERIIIKPRKRLERFLY